MRVRTVFAWSGQAIAYALFAVVVGYFSNAPAYKYQDPENAQIKVSFSHAGHRKEECRQLTPEEIAKLPPNMRRPTDCPRARWPVDLEVVLDEQVLYRGVHTPTGLWDDGPSTIYQRFSVPTGTHRLSVRLRDSGRTEGYDYAQTAEVELQPRQNFVVGFRAETEGFILD